MPKRKQQKSKKKKKAPPKQNICITISLNPDNRTDKAVIQIKNRHSILFAFKCKHLSFTPSRDAKHLIEFLERATRWDIIAGIVSFCNSFHHEQIYDDNHWRKYIKTQIENNYKLSTAIEDTIIERVRHLFRMIYGYSNEPKTIKLSNEQLDSVIIGYLRIYLKRINDNRFPVEIIGLVQTFYGNLSNFMYNAQQNLLIVSQNIQQRQTFCDSHSEKGKFIFYGDYALYSEGWEINCIDTTKIVFTFRIDSDCTNNEDILLSMGLMIYSKAMAKDLENGKWVNNQQKYFGFIKDGDDRVCQGGWQKGDVATIVIGFELECESNEDDMTNWMLEMTLFRNGADVVKKKIATKPVKYYADSDENVTRKCYIIFHNRCVYDENVEKPLILTLLEPDMSVLQHWWVFPMERYTIDDLFGKGFHQKGSQKSFGFYFWI